MKKKTALFLLSLAGIFVACSGSSSSSPPLNNFSPPAPNPNLANGVDSGMDTGTDASVDASIDAPNDTGSPPPPCISENDIQFCARYSSTCGSVVGTDNCNVPRTVLSCGNCKATDFCNSGVCTSIPCVPETDLALCAQAGKVCGVSSIADNCGTIRTPNCGTCQAPTVCHANACCSPLSCGALNCGAMNDGCGGILPCNNTCPGGYTCTNNICVPPACVPETNMAFCARTGHNCGTVSDVDNCGSPRTLSSCGSLKFAGTGAQFTGGIPLEFGGSGAKYISAWVNIINPTTGNPTIVALGHGDAVNDEHFQLYITPSRLLALETSPSTIGTGVSTISIPLDVWTFVFAGTDGYTNFVGKIVNGAMTKQSVSVFSGSMAGGDPFFHVGDNFFGEMNNIQFWAKPFNDAEVINSSYHDCIPNEPGLVRQWCMLEGAGNITVDTATGIGSSIGGATWKTGSCLDGN